VKSRVERYRVYAADCAKLAASAQDEQARAMLMRMADAWVRMAISKEELAEPNGCPGHPRPQAAMGQGRGKEH
jgi:hypothetical protein